MQEESRTELFTMALTPWEKKLLAELAQERGATMSGIVRKLIRDAAHSAYPERQLQEAGRYAAGQ